MFRRKAFISLISILLCWNTALAQYPSLLWEISGNGLEKPSYLYGTIHSTDERVFAFGDSTRKVWKTTEVMAGELYISDDSAGKAIKYVMLPPGKELSDYMSEKEYKKVMKYAEKRMGSSAPAVKKMKPIYSAYFLAKQSEHESLYPQRKQTLDEYLQLFARQTDKEVRGLETYEEQLSALDKIPMEEQVDALIQTVKEKKTTGDEFEKMMGIYLSQNLDSLMVFMKENPQYSDNFNQSLIVERNQRMVDRIIPLITAKPAFIAVGAAHLPDEKGIIELLRQKGFTVRPVYSPFHKVEKK